MHALHVNATNGGQPWTCPLFKARDIGLVTVSTTSRSMGTSCASERLIASQASMRLAMSRAVMRFILSRTAGSEGGYNGRRDCRRDGLYVPKVSM